MPATKEDIANAFGELVVRYGYRRAAVEDVARALRISKKTIYEHFSTKEDLYAYAIELWAMGQRHRVESMLTAETAIGRISEVTGIAFADVRKGLESDSPQDMSEPPEIIARVNAEVFGPMVRDLIVQGNESGEFNVDDPDLTAAFAVAIGTETVRMIREDPSSHPEESALVAMRRLIAGS